jgi:hypothetical protein
MTRPSQKFDELLCINPVACDFIISIFFGLGNEGFEVTSHNGFEVKVKPNGVIILVELLQTTSTKSQCQTLSFRNAFLITSHFWLCNHPNGEK